MMGLSCFGRCMSYRSKAKIATYKPSSSSTASSQVRIHGRSISRPVLIGGTNTFGWTVAKLPADQCRPETPRTDDPAGASAGGLPMLPAVRFPGTAQQEQEGPAIVPVTIAWPTTPPCAACQRAMERCLDCYRRSQDACPGSACDGCRRGLCSPRPASSSAGLWSDEETLSRLEGRDARAREGDEQTDESSDVESEYGVWLLPQTFEVDNVVVATGRAKLVDISR